LPNALTGEPVIIVRGDDGRVYSADVAPPPAATVRSSSRLAQRVALLVIEGARPHDVTAIVLGAGDAVSLARALSQGGTPGGRIPRDTSRGDGPPRPLVRATVDSARAGGAPSDAPAPAPVVVPAVAASAAALQPAAAPPTTAAAPALASADRSAGADHNSRDGRRPLGRALWPLPPPPTGAIPAAAPAADRRRNAGAGPGDRRSSRRRRPRRRWGASGHRITARAGRAREGQRALGRSQAVGPAWDGKVQSVEGALLVLKADNGSIVMVDISQLNPNVSQALRADAW
jgi:hypothetical protein